MQRVQCCYADSGGRRNAAIVAAQHRAQRLDHQVVIVALRQAGDGDAADDARAFHDQRERAAVGRIIGDGKPIAFEQRGAFRFLGHADGVRAAMEARDHVALAAHPFDVIGRGAFERGIKQRLPETAHVDHQRQSAFQRHGRRREPRSQATCASRRGKRSSRSCKCDFFQILVQSHCKFVSHC